MRSLVPRGRARAAFLLGGSPRWHSLSDSGSLRSGFPTMEARQDRRYKKTTRQHRPYKLTLLRGTQIGLLYQLSTIN